jgi:hypothetical protein
MNSPTKQIEQNRNKIGDDRTERNECKSKQPAERQMTTDEQQQINWQ